MKGEHMPGEQIVKALIGVMGEVRSIGKNRKNPQQGYMFRGIDDIYNAIQPALIKHGVVIVPTFETITREERPSKSGGVLIYTNVKGVFTFYHGSDSVQAAAYGEGMDSSDKSTNKAMSAAFKYALLQTLCIPTEEHIDSEIDSPEPGQQFITQEQITEINNLINETGADSVKFLAYMGVDAVNNIMPSQYSKAISALNAKKKKTTQRDPGQEG